jgi:endoribonuclease LACTB2
MAPRLAEPGPLEEVWKEFVTKTMSFSDRAPDEFYYDGKVFDLGRTRLTALHTPGHCLDHYCFFEDKTGLLLLADLDLSDFGPWYGHRESDIGQTLASLENLGGLNPTLAASSHEEPLKEGFRGRLNTYTEHILTRDKRILELVKRGSDLAAMVEASPIYGGSPFIPELIRYWEEQMIRKHLARLEQTGLIAAEGKQWRIG